MLPAFRFVSLAAVLAVATATLGAEANDDDSGSANTLVGARLDRGIGANSGPATALGARLVRVHPSVSPNAPVAVWWGYGSDLRAVTTGFDSLDAGILSGVDHAGFAAGAGLLEVELLLGVGFANPVTPIWGFTVLYGVPLFGVGISAQYPIGSTRPPWLDPVQVTFRVQIPLGGCRINLLGCEIQ